MNIIESLRNKKSPAAVSVKEPTRGDLVAQYQTAKTAYMDGRATWEKQAEEAQERLRVLQKELAEAQQAAGRVAADRTSAHHLVDHLETRLRASASPQIAGMHADLLKEQEAHRDRLASSATEAEIAVWQRGTEIIVQARSEVMKLQLEDLNEAELDQRFATIAAEVVAATGGES